MTDEVWIRVKLLGGPHDGMEMKMTGIAPVLVTRFGVKAVYSPSERLPLDTDDVVPLFFDQRDGVLP